MTATKVSPDRLLPEGLSWPDIVDVFRLMEATGGRCGAQVTIPNWGDFVCSRTPTHDDADSLAHWQMWPTPSPWWKNDFEGVTVPSPWSDRLLEVRRIILGDGGKT